MRYYKFTGPTRPDDDSDGGSAAPVQEGLGTAPGAVPSADSGLAGGAPPVFQDIAGPSAGVELASGSSDSAVSASSSNNTTLATSQTVTSPGSGLVFNNTFGSGASSTFINDVVAAEHYLQSQFGNACTINCNFDLQSLNKAFSGENSFNPIPVSYSTFVHALEAHATTPTAQAAAAALASLPDPSQGAQWEIPVGEAQILGLASPDGAVDDSVILNSYYWTSSALQNDPGDAEAVVQHELTEGIMGRIGSLGTDGDWAPMDLFRFTASGQRDFTGGQDGQPTYFSVDGSTVYTGLQYHNSISALGQFDGFDLADWDQVGADANAHDPFGPGGPGAGDPGALSATDIQIMQALGWAPPTSKTVTRTDTNAYGSVDLAQVGNNYFLYAHGTTTGPELNYNGAPVTVGEFGNWTPLGAALTSAGYDVAWYVPGANQYTVWQIDSSGKFLSSLGLVAGNNNAFESYEMVLNQDLNGDGTIGVTDTNALGSTTLSEVANHYAISSGGGSVTLQYNGAPVTAGEFGGWMPFGAALTATGYDVAWEVPGANQYTVWQTDSSGQFLSSLGLVPGNNATLISDETVFNQDLNGNGTTGGAPIATIQSQESLPGSSSGAETVLLTDGADATSASVGGDASSNWLTPLDAASPDASIGWGGLNFQALAGEPLQSDSSPLYSLSDFDFIGEPGSGISGPSALQSPLSQSGAALDPAGSNALTGASQFGAPSLGTLGLAGPGASAADNIAIEPPASPGLAGAGLHHT